MGEHTCTVSSSFEERLQVLAECDVVVGNCYGARGDCAHQMSLLNSMIELGQSKAGATNRNPWQTMSQAGKLRSHQRKVAPCLDGRRHGDAASDFATREL